MTMTLQPKRRTGALHMWKSRPPVMASLLGAGAATVGLLLSSCGDKRVEPVAAVDAPTPSKAMKPSQGDPVVRYAQGRFSNSGQQLLGKVSRVAPATPEESTVAKQLAERLKLSLGNRLVEEEVRSAAAALETDAVIEVAKALLDSPNADTRAAAIQLLAGSDSPVAVALLNQAFGDADADLRQLAFQSAAVLPPDQLETGLLKGLDDSELGVRQAAFQAATAQAGPTADRAVQKGVNSSHADITLAALTHLEVAMQKAEVPTVINALGHSNPQVRELASEILGTLTYQSFAAAPQAKQWWQENQHHFDQDLVVSNPENYPAFNLTR